MEVSYKGVKIRAVTSDITQQEVDAIVNAANSQMIMGGGVAGAIKRAGGEEIEKEAMKHAPVPVGKAIATTAGRLKAKWVIHAPTMERPAMRIGAENVRAATRAALDCADEVGAKTIAIPALGAGVGGVPAEIVTEVMCEELKKKIDEGTEVSEVRLVSISDDMTKKFGEAMKKVFGA